MRVRPLTPHDIPAVLDINRVGAPGVTFLTADEIDHMKSQGFHFWVIEDIAGVILGYLSACQYPENPDTSEYQGEAYLALQDVIQGPFLYVDQIAIRASNRRQGLAKILYRKAGDWALQCQLPILACEVNVQPPNPVSTALHQSLEFKPLKNISVSDGTVVCLMSKELTPYDKSAQTPLPLIWEQEGKNF